MRRLRHDPEALESTRVRLTGAKDVQTREVSLLRQGPLLRLRHARRSAGEEWMGNNMTSKNHWESVYEHKAADAVSWYRPHLERSLVFITNAGLAKDAGIIDVGGGTSTLVDDLLARGYESVSVLDIAATAIDVARTRLGNRANAVKWLIGDITTMALPEHAYDFWHDRAVFHFLRDEAERQGYVAAVRHALKPGGHIVVATFGPHGPEQCSGLDVMRYSPDQLHAQFGGEFHKIDSATEVHTTPWGKEQQFVYCYCRIS
jgi:SAM-dependent methyltransferase